MEEFALSEALLKYVFVSTRRIPQFATQFVKEAFEFEQCICEALKP
jgi:hypothetical protein